MHRRPHVLRLRQGLRDLAFVAMTAAPGLTTILVVDFIFYILATF